MKSTLRTIGLGTAGLALAVGMTGLDARKPLKAPIRPLARPAIANSGVDRGVVLLAMGENRVLNLPAPMTDVIIADPNVLDVHVRTQNQLYLMGKAPGQTDLTITNAAGQPIYKATVRIGNNLTSLDQMMRLAMPDADIKITTMNGTILLTGTVAAPEDAQEAEQLVGGFSKLPVLSRLRTATPLTVNLQVRIAEVNKNISKTVGMNLMTYDPTSGFKFGIGQGRTQTNGKWLIGGTLATGPGSTGVFDSVTGAQIGSGVATATSGTTIAAQYRAFGMDILQTLDLAENQGLATTLANPNLTALSGETASFLAGGEIPIPIASSLGQTSVEFKQYGVSLAFTPTVLADGRISLRVKPEVSQLDDSAGVKLNGYSIPGISTRRAETTVELGSGQSFMIGGLLNASTSNSVSKAPWLGDLPILGNLFKSTSFNRRETEVVIVVTPYLVKPVDARDIKLPNDGFRNANDIQRYWGAKLHDSKSGAKRPMPEAAPPATVKPQDAPADAARKTSSRAAAPGFSF